MAERRTGDCADYFAGAWLVRLLDFTSLISKLDDDRSDHLESVQC